MQLAELLSILQLPLVHYRDVLFIWINLIEESTLARCEEVLNILFIPDCLLLSILSTETIVHCAHSVDLMVLLRELHTLFMVLLESPQVGG